MDGNPLFLLTRITTIRTMTTVGAISYSSLIVEDMKEFVKVSHSFVRKKSKRTNEFFIAYFINQALVRGNASAGAIFVKGGAEDDLIYL